MKALRALSLTQPWASLIVIGAKRIETRSWWTTYRGMIAIHAAKKFPADCRDLCWDEPFRSTLEGAALVDYHSYDDLEADSFERFTALPLGMIVAVAQLRQVTETTDLNWMFAHDAFGVQPDIEREFGDYSPGRFAWVLGDVRPLLVPIPCKGSLGLWTVPAMLYEAIAPQLAMS